jgi:hypothetical protein
VSRGDMSATIALRRSDLQVLWGHGDQMVVAAEGTREVLGDVQPRERVAELAAIGPRPEGAEAHAARLDALAADALGRMSAALFRGRLAELAIELDPDEQVLHLSDGKLDRVNGLVVLTDRRLLFLGEAIRRSKRREEVISLAELRDHVRTPGLRPSLRVSAADGRVIDLRIGRTHLRELCAALEGALQR